MTHILVWCHRIRQDIKTVNVTPRKSLNLFWAYLSWLVCMVKHLSKICALIFDDIADCDMQSIMDDIHFSIVCVWRFKKYCRIMIERGNELTYIPCTLVYQIITQMVMGCQKTALAESFPSHLWHDWVLTDKMVLVLTWLLIYLPVYS